MIYEEFDLTEFVGSELLENRFKKMTKINWHSVRIIMGFLLVFIIGGLQALNSSGLNVGDMTAIIGFLGMLEHVLEGNSSLTK